MPTRTTPLALLALLAASVAVVASGSTERKGQDADAALARGEALFQSVCSGYCHPTEPGTPGDAPDLFDCEWVHGDADADLLRVLREGVPDTLMVGFDGKIPDDDLSAVVGYVRAASRCDEGREP